jgi:hypothetical protein
MSLGYENALSANFRPQSIRGVFHRIYIGEGDFSRWDAYAGK